MNVLEHEEAPDHSEPPVTHPPDRYLENDRKLEIAGILWQLFRVLLLAWSLLCFYCSVRLCLLPKGIVFSSVAFHFCIGLVAWISACKIGQPMEWLADDEPSPAVDPAK